MGAPVLNKVSNGAQHELMSFRKLNEVWQPGHGPVFVENFADHSRGMTARERSEIATRLGVARPG